MLKGVRTTREASEVTSPRAATDRLPGGCAECAVELSCAASRACVAMALSKLSGDEQAGAQGIIHLHPGPAAQHALEPRTKTSEKVVTAASEGVLRDFLPEVREFIKDTRPKTNTTRGGRKAHRPTPKTRTIHPTVLPDPRTAGELQAWLGLALGLGLG